MVAAAAWTFADGMDLTAVVLERHVFWAKMSYLGAGTVSVFLLLFALEYTGQSERVGPRSIGALLAVPLLGFSATYFNEYHGLTWPGFMPSPTDPRIVTYEHGPLFYVLLLYSFALLFVTTVILVGFARRAPRVYRRQSLTIVFAIAVPWSAMIVYIGAPGRFPGFNPSIALVCSGILLVFGLLRHRLLDLVPIARETLVETMSDGLLAVDALGRVVDLNPAGMRLLGLDGGDQAGRSLDDLLEGWPALAQRIEGVGNRSEKFVVESGSHHLGFEILPLQDRAGVHQGGLVILRDLTTQVETEKALKQANEELKVRVADIESLHAELSEQAIRDPLTGLLNRRYLTEMLAGELGRASREHYPVSFVMLDIDGFKHINDVFGHATGDLILRVLGSQLLSHVRPGDIACRYGGDEFLIVLTNTDLPVARRRAEQWRVGFEESSTSLMGLDRPVSISVGVATYPTHGESAEQVFAAADAALYSAKAAGRNRVTASPA